MVYRRAIIIIFRKCKIDEQSQNNSTRFQVQYVVRPQTKELHDYRGYAGSVLSGKLIVGDTVQILPLDISTQISKIEKNGIRNTRSIN